MTHHILWNNYNIFSGIDTVAKAELGKIVRILTLPKDACLFHFKDEGKAVYVIKSGEIKLSRQTNDGLESVISIAIAGDVLGENLIFGDKYYNYDVAALSEVEIYIFPVMKFRLLIKNSKTLLDNIIKIILKRNSDLLSELEHIKVQNAAQRMGCCLLMYYQKAGCDGQFKLPVEKGVLAAKLGMKAETLSRALNKLEKLGVSIERSDVVIKDINAISCFACSTCSEHFPCFNT